MNERTKSIILKVLGFGFKAAWFILKCVVRYVITLLCILDMLVCHKKRGRKFLNFLPLNYCACNMSARDVSCTNVFELYINNTSVIKSS